MWSVEYGSLLLADAAKQVLSSVKWSRQKNTSIGKDTSGVLDCGLTERNNKEFIITKNMTVHFKHVFIELHIFEMV